MSQEERRTGLRTAARHPSRAATLELDRGEFAVLVVDESMTGLGVVGVHLVELRIGTICHLQSKLGRRECRVVGVHHIELDDAVVTRVGMEWVD